MIIPLGSTAKERGAAHSGGTAPAPAPTAKTANPFDALGEYDIRFKIRHTEIPIAGKLLHTTDGWAVESSEPLQGIAPGQFGVVYDAEGQRCIGSGEIRL